jgi:hypothetical protein
MVNHGVVEWIVGIRSLWGWKKNIQIRFKKKSGKKMGVIAALCDQSSLK